VYGFKSGAFMREYKWTAVGLIAAFTLWAVTVSLDLDLFETFASCLQQYESIEADEIIFPVVIFNIFLLIDLIRRNQSSRVEIEKCRVYRSTLKAMNHILNNFLQKMLLFKLTAEETKGFDPEVLKRYDTIIDEAKAQIDALECIAKPDEKTILDTIGDPL